MIHLSLEAPSHGPSALRHGFRVALPPVRLGSSAVPCCQFATAAGGKSLVHNQPFADMGRRMRCIGRLPVSRLLARLMPQAGGSALEAMVADERAPQCAVSWRTLGRGDVQAADLLAGRGMRWAVRVGGEV